MSEFDWTKAISKLTELTKLGEVTWEEANSLVEDAKAKRNIQAFQTTFLDETFVLRQYELYVPPRKDNLFTFMFSETEKLNGDYWTQNTELMICSDSANWILPYSSATKDLFRAVTYQKSGASRFSDEFSRRFLK